ncbi:MAG: 6-phosphogluconolactonase [Chromatiales bacterium]|jgi:6-phosphogluconolactonase
MTNLQQIKWHVSNDAAAVARDASDRIIHEARNAIGDRGVFKVVLAGGSTPQQTYRYLARGDSDWSRWQLYLGDERCVEAEDPLRNSVMIRDTLLSHVAIPQQQVHFIHADQGFDNAIEDYEKKVRRARPFDLVMLGMGDDGHTASLFPGNEYDKPSELVAVDNSPFEPAERISLSYAALNDARKVMVLIAGAGKRETVQRWLDGEDLPISRITGLHGIDVYIDREAYPCD